MIYPSPKEDPSFTEYWDKYIDGIASRDNFKVEYLDQLRILCELFVENDELVEEVRIGGRTYMSEGRNGSQLKINPLVSQLNKTRGEIRAYTSLLGLQIIKDNKVKEDETRKTIWK